MTSRPVPLPSKPCPAPLRAALACALVALAFSNGRAQNAVGDVYATDASVKGSVILASGGTRVLSGSTVSAGMGAATLKLARGGLLRVCPGTNLAVSSSQHGLSLGFSDGAVELHYDVAASADALQTPDFRLMLAGPGTFHLAVSADALGNTCIRSLPHNNASVIVQELFGDATYQVKPDEQVVFRKGHVADLTHEVPPDCGCPVGPSPAIERAEAAPPLPQNSPPRRANSAEPKAAEPRAAALHLSAPPASPTPAEPAAPAPAAAAHLEVEAPFVFHGESTIPEPPVVALVRLSDRDLPMTPTVLPPAGPAAAAVQTPVTPAKPQSQKRFFGRVRSFFASLFK